MTKIVLLLLLLVSTTLFAQSDKKEVLLDENGKELTQEEFLTKLNSRVERYTYFRTQTLSDSTIQNRLVPRKDIGKITKESRSEIVKALKDISGKIIESNQTIIINFFFKDTGHDERAILEQYSSNKKLEKFLQRNNQCVNFYVIEKNLDYNNNKVYEDKFDRIKDMLFVLPFPINFIIIKPDGQYYKFIGEYSEKDIPKILEAEW